MCKSKPQEDPNSIPLRYSHFHVTRSKSSKIKEGIRWIKKATSCCQMVSPGAKESAANKLIKSMANYHWVIETFQTEL